MSCSTALHVLRAIDASRYTVDAIGIDTGGRWFRLDEAQVEAARHLDVSSLQVSGTPIRVGEISVPDGTHDQQQVVVLPLLHGPFGEDGTIQGLFEMLDVPYVGSGVLASALAMDKSMAKSVFAAAGLSQARHLVCRGRPIQHGEVLAQIDSTFGFPCFVKPANMGSSVGVSRVEEPSQLGDALKLAATYDDTVLVEEAITGREIEVAVLGNEDPVAFGPGEVVPADSFYSYADKYLDGRSNVVVPADLPSEIVEEVKALAIRAFTSLGCSGLARCDFFFEEPGRGLLINEVNTMPGFTPISMYPKMVLAGGVSYSQLVDRLISLGVERHQNRSARVDHP